MIAPPVPAHLWDRYPPPCRPLRPPTWLGGAGGLSGADLWRVEASRGPTVLRAWPDPGPSPDQLDRVHRWLDQLRELAIVAVPLATRAGATWFEAAGRRWELAPWMPGSADLRRPPSAVHLIAMFTTLARIHAILGVPTIRGHSPGLVARNAEVTRLIGGEFATLEAALERSPRDERSSLGSRWLVRAHAGVSRVVAPLDRVAAWDLDLQPCLRDVRPDHFLFEGDRLTGLIDFGAMGVDSVAGDLARLLGETVGDDRSHRSIALAAYASIRPLDDSALSLIPIFEAANAVLGGARWVRWHFVEGRRFHDPAAVLAGLQRTLDRLEAWLGRET